MASTSEIKKQIAALQDQLAKTRREELAQVIERVKALIAKHELTAEDLGMQGSAGSSTGPKKRGRKPGQKNAMKKPAGIAKYRDPKTGKTWTGNGQAPGWIKDAKNRDKFLIAAGDDSAAASTDSAAPVAAASPKQTRRKAGRPAGRAASKKAAVEVTTPEA